MRSLGGLRILIVEDEYILADDLAQHFRNVGAQIVGPAPDMATAFKLLAGVEAAILDVNLNGVMVFPLADKLLVMGIPFVFFSGHDDVGIPVRFRQASRLSKPASWRDVTRSILAMPIGVLHQPVSTSDVMAMLPKLQLAARIMLQDPGAADRLVERTLEQALQQGHWPNDLSVPQWLHKVMTQLLQASGPSLMQ